MSVVSRRAMLASSLASVLGGNACSRTVPEAREAQSSSREILSSNEIGAENAAKKAPEPVELVRESAPETELVSAESLESAESAAVVCERVVTIVARNHGHELLVAESDVLAQVERTYSVRGSSSHEHRLTISVEEFALVARGEVLRKKTELGAAHRHRILVRCEPAVLPPDSVSACDAVIAGEDGHEIVIPESHVRGGADREYDVQGVSGHTHTLLIRAADFSRLLAGEQLDLKTTSSAAHFHHAYIKYLGAALPI